MLIVKSLALLFLACLSLLIVVGLTYIVGRWIYEQFLSDSARIKKDKEELQNILNKLKKEAKNEI